MKKVNNKKRSTERHTLVIIIFGTVKPQYPHTNSPYWSPYSFLKSPLRTWKINSFSFCQFSRLFTCMMYWFCSEKRFKGMQLNSSASWSYCGVWRRFPFNGLKCRKFHVPNETVQSGCTDPTQGTARLVFVFVTRIQKSSTGDNNLSNGKGYFGPTDRNYQTGHSGPPSKLVPNIPVGPNRVGPFHLIYQPKLAEFWVEWKAP